MSIDLLTSQFASVTPNTSKGFNRNRNIVADRPWTMERIDAMPGARNNFIRVAVANPKKVNSDAYNAFHLYGELNKPSVTVAQFLKSWHRAVPALLWDLNRGIVTIVELADAA